MFTIVCAWCGKIVKDGIPGVSGAPSTSIQAG